MHLLYSLLLFMTVTKTQYIDWIYSGLHFYLVDVNYISRMKTTKTFI